jgi:GT2 family glycosyltransferase
MIATRDRARLLEQLLTRLAEMLGPGIEDGSVEVLVCDDGSTDDTESVCRRHAPAVRTLRCAASAGYIEARRRLMREARGDYLMQLDDDSCLLDADGIDRVREVFAERPECAVILANIASPDLPAGYAPVTAEPIAVGRFIGNGAAFRTDAMRTIGGYPPFLAGYGAEEIAVSLLVLDRGWDILFVPRLRVFHALDPSNRPLGAQRGSTYANEAAIVVGMYPLWLALPALVYKTVSYVRYNARQGTLRAFLATQRELPGRLRQAVRQRRPVSYQSIRRFHQLRPALDAVRRAHERAGAEPWPGVGGLFASTEDVSCLPS